MLCGAVSAGEQAERVFVFLRVGPDLETAGSRSGLLSGERPALTLAVPTTRRARRRCPKRRVRRSHAPCRAGGVRVHRWRTPHRFVTDVGDVVPGSRRHQADDLIALVPHRGRTVLDRVVVARGHLQHTADELDPQTPAGDDIVAVGVDEPGYFLCWRSSSAMLLCQLRLARRLLEEAPADHRRRSGRRGGRRRRHRRDVVAAASNWRSCPCPGPAACLAR